MRLAGADEAGRGCLAGPLVAAAVVLDYRARLPALKGLTDSKLLTPDGSGGSCTSTSCCTPGA